MHAATHHPAVTQRFQQLRKNKHGSSSPPRKSSPRSARKREPTAVTSPSADDAGPALISHHPLLEQSCTDCECTWTCKVSAPHAQARCRTCTLTHARTRDADEVAHDTAHTDGATTHDGPPTAASALREGTTPNTPPRGPTRCRVQFLGDAHGSNKPKPTRMAIVRSETGDVADERDESHHLAPNAPSPPPTDSDSSTTHACRHCNAQHTSRNALFAHVRTHCVGALVHQRIDELAAAEQQPMHAEQRTQRSNALLTSAAAVLLATTLAEPPPGLPTSFTEETVHEHALMLAEPLPTGAGPLGITVSLADDEGTHSERLVAFYDTGAGCSAITPELCARLHIMPERGNGGKKQRICFSGFTAGVRYATHTAVVAITVGKERTVPMRFWVVDDAPVQLLVGRDNMSKGKDGSKEGRSVLIDPDVDNGSITFVTSGRTYRAVTPQRRPAATFLVDTTVPALAQGVVRVQTTVPNATVQLPRAWLSSTLYSTHKYTVTNTDSDGCAMVSVTNMDSEPTTIHAGTPLTMAEEPTLLTPMPTGTTLTYRAAAAAAANATQSLHRQTTTESPCSFPASSSDGKPEAKPLTSTAATPASSPPPASDTGTSGTSASGFGASPSSGTKSGTASNHHPSASCPGDRPPLIPPATQSSTLHATATTTTTTESTQDSLETDLRADHGVQPITRMDSKEMKRGTSWGNSGEHDAIVENAYMTPQELRRHLRKSVADNKLLTAKQREKLLTCLMENIAAFSDEDHPIGHIVGHEVSFKRLDNKPIYVPARPMNPIIGAEACRQVEALVKDGTMGPTTSPNNFPLVMVRKSAGAPPRMCVDMRSYNSRYVGEMYSIPNIRECINKIAQGKIYSALDATSSFHMVGLRDDDGPVPSTHQIPITLPDGRRFSYRKMPFGARDSSFVFSRILNQILEDFQAESSIYIDDICLHSDDINAQIELLGRVLPRLITAGVRLNPRKTSFCVDKVDVLGHTVSHQAVGIQEDKLAAIKQLQAPQSRRELQSLVGVLSWSRRFVHEYALRVEPLTRLLRKGQPTSWPDAWGAEQEQAFRFLQSQLLSHPTLASPDFTKGFEVWTDASDIGVGAVLVQTDADGNKNAVEFYSKQHTDAEKNYATCEKEALAVLRALTRFRPYLLMANKFTIVVRSDHRGLTSLYKHADESSRLYRWAQQLNEFDYVVEWMSGKSIDAAVPDGLSRARTLLQRTSTLLTDGEEILEPPKVEEEVQAATLWSCTHIPPSATVHEPALVASTRKRGMQAGRNAPRHCAPPPAAAAAPDDTDDDDPCTRTPTCAKQAGHIGRCKAMSAAQVKAAADATADKEHTYDHLVCRAHRGGIQGYRMRWRGFGPEDDTYESTWRIRREVTGHHVDSLISDFVRRERQGDVDVSRQPGAGYEAWENSLSPEAVHIPAAPTMHAAPTPPFPTAEPHSDRGFLEFDGIGAEQLRLHQQTEPDTADILKYLGDDTHRPDGLPSNQHHAWTVYADSVHVDNETGLMMREYVGSTGPHVGQRHHVLLLPKVLLQQAFDWAHALAGHHGITATMWIVKTRFHCWHLERHLRAYIDACDLCQRADKTARQTPYGSIPVTTFGETVGFDFTGPYMAVGAQGEKNLCIIVDHATKYVVVIPTKGQTGQDALDALTKYIMIVGTIPKTIFTDQGSYCKPGTLFTALLKRFGIKNHQAMSMNPQGDGLAEAQVKNICRIIRKAVQDYPEKWPEVSQWAAYCYNCKMNTTTGTSPFYAMHAVEPRQPIDFLLPRVDGQDPPANITELSNRIGEINAAVEKGVEALHQSYAQRNKHVRGARDFTAGDLVWKMRVYPESFEAAGIDTKFHMPYEPEPYPVLERRSAQHSRVRPAWNPSAKYEDIHHGRLKHCRPREDAIQFPMAVPVQVPAADDDAD